MAIGTPVLLGTASAGGTGTTISVTTGSAASAGDLIVVPVFSAGSVAITSVTDSASNTYASGTIQLSSGVRLGCYYSRITNALGAGGTITLTLAASTGNKAMMALHITGIKGPANADAVDVYAQATPGTVTAITTTSGTLGQADEILIGASYINGAGDTWTEDAGWTAIGGAVAGGGVTLRSAYKIVSSTSSVDRTTTNSASRLQMANLLTFKAASVTPPPAGAKQSNLLFMGLG